ncbi:MAG: CapA family protein [Amphritea sp.]
MHFGDVQESINTLKKNHFDLLSLANNHAMDYGMPGLTQTLKLARQSKIDTCGAGNSEKEAAQPYLQTIRLGTESINIAILCAYKYVKKYNYVYKHYATSHRGGVYKLNINKLKKQILSLKNKGNILIILYLHWGKNYKFASEYQLENGRKFVDAGADIVIGHGAHVLQEIEFRNNKWIVCNLGNFVFNSPGKYKKQCTSI